MDGARQLTRCEARFRPAQLPLDKVVLPLLRGLTSAGGGVALLAGLILPVERGRWGCDRFSRGSVGWRRSEEGLCEAGLLDDTDASVEKAED